MTKAELIKHIENRFSDDEQVVAIFVSQDDLLDTPSNLAAWEKFVHGVEQGWVQDVPEDLVEKVVSEYEEFVEANYPDED